MKRLIYSLLLLLLTVGVRAQNPSFSPTSFTAEDEFTLTIDVSSTPIAGEAEAYIWIFSNKSIDRNNTALSAQYPAINGVVNGDWTNSAAAAKMTAAGTNKWSFKITGTIIFGLSPAQLKDFGFLVKTKNGAKQTADYFPYFFDPLVFVPTMLRVFPAKVSATDIVTVNFDRSLGGTANEQRMTPVSATITAFDDAATPVQVGSPITVTVRPLATNIWSATFDPKTKFTPATGRKLKSFKYKFNGTTLDVNGATITVSSSETEYTFAELQ